jgi:hypothetical protein
VIIARLATYAAMGATAQRTPWCAGFVQLADSPHCSQRGSTVT